MTTASTAPFNSKLGTWLSQAEAWLDAKGKPGWIAAMVAGFILFPPIGLALLAYMIWGKRMFGKCNRSQKDRFSLQREGRCGWSRGAGRSSGNAAFDSYKADTLRRLEDEQDAFEAFLQRLRDARDKQEFDRFMDDRASAGREAEAPTAAPAEADAPRRGEY